MLEIGFPVQFADFCEWFDNLKTSVWWQSATSQFFDVISGVLQGSLLSTKFYNLIMDKLLFLLQKSNLGYRIEGISFGAVTYADDLIICLMFETTSDVDNM